MPLRSPRYGVSIDKSADGARGGYRQHPRLLGRRQAIFLRTLHNVGREIYDLAPSTDLNFEIDHQFNPCGPDHRHVRWFLPFENARHGARPHTASRRTTEGGTVHSAVPPCQSRQLAGGVLRAEAQSRPRVDGVTWQDYESDLELRLEDLHGRVHRGARNRPAGRTSRRRMESSGH